MRHVAKFFGDLSNCFSDSDLTTYKMAAVRHLGLLKCRILTTIEVQSKCGSSCLVMAGSWSTTVAEI